MPDPALIYPHVKGIRLEATLGGHLGDVPVSLGCTSTTWLCPTTSRGASPQESLRGGSVSPTKATAVTIGQQRDLCQVRGWGQAMKAFSVPLGL